METTATIEIAREAAKLAFLCENGCGFKWTDWEPGSAITSDSSFEQEKAELLAGIRQEVEQYGAANHDVRRDVYREVLAHLAAGSYGLMKRPGSR
jgi:hypothetical protein